MRIHIHTAGIGSSFTSLLTRGQTGPFFGPSAFVVAPLEVEQMTPQRPQLSNLGVDLRQAPFDQNPSVAARTLAPIADLQKLPDVAQSQARALRGFDELKPLGGLLVVEAIARLGSPGGGQKSKTVVVAKGVWPQAEAVGERGNGLGHTPRVNLGVSSKVKPNPNFQTCLSPPFAVAKQGPAGRGCTGG